MRISAPLIALMACGFGVLAFPDAAVAEPLLACTFGPAGYDDLIHIFLEERGASLIETNSNGEHGESKYAVLESNTAALLATQNVKAYAKADPQLVRRARSKAEIMASLTVTGAAMTVIALDRASGALQIISIYSKGAPPHIETGHCTASP